MTHAILSVIKPEWFCQPSDRGLPLNARGHRLLSPGREQAGDFGDRLRLAEASQARNPTPCPARAADSGVVVQHGTGLPVRQPGEPGVRADVTGADDLAGTGPSV